MTATPPVTIRLRQLRTAVDPNDVTRSTAYIANDLIDALEAALAVHQPVYDLTHGLYRCVECGVYLTDHAPDCRTVAVITNALNGEDA